MCDAWPFSAISVCSTTSTSKNCYIYIKKKNHAQDGVCCCEFIYFFLNFKAVEHLCHLPKS